MAVASFDIDSWMKENTARRGNQSRANKPRREFGYIRRIADEQFRKTAALNFNMWDTSEESDPFDLPSPLMIYSLNKKGRWNCLQRLRRIGDMQTENVHVMALEKYLLPNAEDKAGRWAVALHEVDSNCMERHRNGCKSTVKELSLRSVSADRHKVTYEIALGHPSIAVWNKQTKEAPRFGRILGRRSTARKSSRRYESVSDDLSLDICQGMTLTDQTPDPPTQRKPMVIPLVDCIRLKQKHKHKTKKTNTNNLMTCKKLDDWEVVADDSKSEFDGDWELV